MIQKIEVVEEKQKLVNNRHRKKSADNGDRRRITLSQDPASPTGGEEQKEFELSPKIGLQLKRYHFGSFLQMRDKPTALIKIQEAESNSSELTTPVKQDFTEESKVDTSPKQNEREESKRDEAQSPTKLVKLKDIKKNFNMTLGRNKLKGRYFVRKTTLQLDNIPKPVAKYPIRQKQSSRELRLGKDIVERKLFCKYLMQPPSEGTLVIKVTDTGCGMTQEEVKKLFQPFTQANKGVFSAHGGTGLGLWISHKLIHAMKGSISCESQVGAGTTFTVKIPAKCKTGTKDAKKVDITTPSICKGLTVVLLTKHYQELQPYLRKFGCTEVVCYVPEELYAMLRVLLFHSSLFHINPPHLTHIDRRTIKHHELCHIIRP